MKFAKACLVASAALFVAPTARSEPSPQQAEAARADTAKPDVASLLFGDSQWSKAPIGSTLTYVYSKKTAQATFGPSFDDRIVMKLDPGDTADRRTAEVKMFSGERTLPAGPFESSAQNPVLLLVLEENVQELSKLFKANPRYLKNAIRKAWRDEAKIDRTSIVVDGKSVPGTRVAVTPFLNDSQKDKMMGLEDMSYVVEVADSVPGQIAKIDIRAPAAGLPKFSETLNYTAEKKP